LLGRYFAHRLIVRPLANMCAPSERMNPG
jgi:hypothetical protein